jgi:hypothetical protein
MKTIAALLACMIATNAFADGAVAEDEAPPAATMHRYVIERTFPAGALEGLDTATKDQVNTNNDRVGVRWIESFATPDLTKTYCIYEAPSEAAIRDAARLNGLPIDKITEVPAILLPH